MLPQCSVVIHVIRVRQVIKVEEEEWSYVPVGGPLPKARQTVTAFGAAANLVRWPEILIPAHAGVASYAVHGGHNTTCLETVQSKISECRSSPTVHQVHPATGYSIARSLREAPGLAADLADILAKDLTVGQTAEAAWHALWPAEKRRQVTEARPQFRGNGANRRG